MHNDFNVSFGVLEQIVNEVVTTTVLESDPTSFCAEKKVGEVTMLASIRLMRN